MNIYRNKNTGAIIEIPSEFGSNDVWEKVGKPSSEPVVEKTEKVEKAPAKKTTRKATTK